MAGSAVLKRLLELLGGGARPTAKKLKQLDNYAQYIDVDPDKAVSALENYANNPYTSEWLGGPNTQYGIPSFWSDENAQAIMQRGWEDAKYMAPQFRLFYRGSSLIEPGSPRVSIPMRKGGDLVVPHRQFIGSTHPLEYVDDARRNLTHADEYGNYTGIWAGTPYERAVNYARIPEYFDGGNPYGRVYPVYINMRRPLVIDANGAAWDDLNFAKVQREGMPANMLPPRRLVEERRRDLEQAPGFSDFMEFLRLREKETNTHQFLKDESARISQLLEETTPEYKRIVDELKSLDADEDFLNELPIKIALYPSEVPVYFDHGSPAYDAVRSAVDKLRSNPRIKFFEDSYKALSSDSRADDLYDAFRTDSKYDELRRLTKSTPFEPEYLNSFAIPERDLLLYQLRDHPWRDNSYLGSTTDEISRFVRNHPKSKFDGVIFDNIHDGADDVGNRIVARNVVPNENEQIKLAHGNFTFNTMDPRWAYSILGLDGLSDIMSDLDRAAEEYANATVR